jgi:hypothetical protein
MDRSNAVLELLVSLAASMTIALLVLAGGATIDGAGPVASSIAAFSAEIAELGIDADDPEGASPRQFLCCAFVNAESGASR